ncbi:MAG: M28 family peptidase [Actinobacteria bacterium]|nr:M28 family peptidase [Actinomycetota bacterium]
MTTGQPEGSAIPAMPETVVGPGAPVNLAQPEPINVLREVVETLAPIDKTPCSPGERQAAEWIAERFRAAECARVDLEDEPSWGPFPKNVVGIGALSVFGWLLALRGRRGLGSAVMAAGTVALIDEVQNGPRVVRRLFRRRQKTVNVLARCGEIGAPKVVLMLAHHDAAQAGAVFDQTLQRKFWERYPNLVENTNTPPPQWWIGPLAPLLGIAGTALRNRVLTVASGVLGVLGVAMIADIARNKTVPGANDNLSGVAVLMAVAEALRARPVDGVEVWLASCGAEETMQDGIRAFMARHGRELADRDAVALNFDTVGSPHLTMLEGEGPFWMEDYAQPWFRDLIDDVAAREAVALQRGMRARSSTDSVITSRAGLPSTCIVSLNDWRGLSNYHSHSDTPENLDYDTVADAARLGEAVAREMAIRG